MKLQSAMRAHSSGIRCALMAAALFAFATPLAAQIQPKTPAPSLTPQRSAPRLPSPQQRRSPPPRPTPVPAPTPESLAKGKSILLAAAKASGGDALKTVKSLEVRVVGPSHHAKWPHGSHTEANDHFSRSSPQRCASFRSERFRKASTERPVGFSRRRD